jgi:hypothetical protein
MNRSDNDGNRQREVVLSAPYKKALWRWLNQHFRSELKQMLANSKPIDSHPGADRLQQLIRSKLAQDGLKDAEDVYQLVVGTTAEEFWCEVRNEVEEDRHP